MTTDEWNLISSLLTSNEWSTLRERLCFNTYDLDISEQALDKAVEHLKPGSKKAEKHLWKARVTCIYKHLPIPSTTQYTDIRELTVDEAVSWYKDWEKHLNDYGCDDVYTVYAMGLFYKKDGKWVIYEVNENK